MGVYILGFLKKIRAHLWRVAKLLSGSESSNAHSFLNHSIINKVKKRNLTYLSKSALAKLVEITIANEKLGIEGYIIEAGCGLGGSAIVIAGSKAIERPFYIYDVFGMIPPPSEKDGKDVHERYELIKAGKSTGVGGGVYYGYVNNLYQEVRNSFKNFGLDVNANNITLIKGLYQDTMRVNFPVSLAHIDCDWYESVITCLQRIWPNLAIGGTMVIDDYYTWAGCMKAVDEYFNDQNNNDYEFTKKCRLHIVKKGNSIEKGDKQDAIH